MLQDSRLVYLLEPFYSGSHKRWADSVVATSKHTVQLYTLSGAHWKWRMHGGAISLAKKLSGNAVPHALLVSSMVDVALLKSLLPKEWADVLLVVYFHENQFVYPDGNPDRHYMFLNYSSALVADKVVFNSAYNRTSFLDALPPFLSAFPDNQNLESVEVISEKSVVRYPGIEFPKDSDLETKREGTPRILWNHRWEHDKNPELFFDVLGELAKHGHSFELVLLGERFKSYPPCFDVARREFAEQIVTSEWVESRNEYLQLISTCHILPVTSNHEFYGYSVLEAIAAGCQPILPRKLVYPEYNNFLGSVYYDSRDELRQMIIAAIEGTVLKPDYSIFKQEHSVDFTTANLDQILQH